MCVCESPVVRKTRMWLCAWTCLVVTIRLVSCLEEESLSDTSESQDPKSHQQHQQGSWAHWWTYDGISGPDYWNINKRWRLCSLGQKQSPVDIRTERLVYDHLLGAIHLNWSQQKQQHSSTAAAAADKQQPKQNQVRVRLLNSGRGVEAWLPEAPSQSQLVLSRGPLSYEYNLFKIELHSAATTPGYNQQQSVASSKAGSGTRISRQVAISSNELDKDNKQNDNEQDEDEDEDEQDVPEHLRLSKSSEHLIDGRPFDAELQLHFYNKRLASSASEAQHLAGHDEGRSSLFAAISVFLIATSATTTTTTTASSQSSPVDELMLNNLGSLQNQGDSLEVSVDRELLERLVPERRHYITYQGSMNRPPCSESVDWIISNRPLRMDLAKFRWLFEKLNTNQENIRPVKPLNRRLLRTTINNLAGQRQAAQTSQQQQQQLQQQLQQQQQEVRSNPVDVRGEFATKASNCSKEDPLKQCQARGLLGIGDTKERSKSCSMRPRYVYQFTYAASSGGGGGSSI